MAPRTPHRPVIVLRPAVRRSGRGTRQSGAPALLAAVAGAVAVAAGAWWFLLPPPQEASGPAAADRVAVDDSSVDDAPIPGDAPADTGATTDGAPQSDEPAAPPAVAEAAGSPAMPDAAAGEKDKRNEADGVFDRLLVLDDVRGAVEREKQWRDEALATALSTGRLAEYGSLLARSVREWAGKRNLSDREIYGGQAGREAMLRHAFLTAAAEDLPALTKDSAMRDFVGWLLQSPDALEAFLLALQPGDEVAKALRVWSDIVDEDPEARDAWRELAIATAVVFDRRQYARTPDGELEGIDPWQRYSYFRTNGESGRLTGNIRTMTASDLVWCVGVPVTHEEMEWALEKVNFRRRNWGKAYGSIKYDMEKAVNGESEKPYDRYTFEEIEKKGGVCADQAYYSAWTACAHGIPAAVIGGDGARGPHAWISWLADRGEWDFAGRFSGYPAGTCRNPQTGHSMSEEEFVRLSDRKASSPERMRDAFRCLWLAGVFGDQPEEAGEWIAAAVKYGPRMVRPATANLEFHVRHRAQSPVDEWKSLLRALRKSFRDCEPLMDAVDRAEDEFVFARQDDDANLADMRRDSRKSGDTRGAEAGMELSLDRLTETYRRQGKLLADGKDYDGVRSIYRKALAQHADNAAAFKALGRDFFSLVSPSPDHAVMACRDLENTCRRLIGRRGGDWFDVTSRNSAWELVADCYAKAGSSRKADEIRRRIESTTDAARRRQI